MMYQALAQPNAIGWTRLSPSYRDLFISRSGTDPDWPTTLDLSGHLAIWDMSADLINGQQQLPGLQQNGYRRFKAPRVKAIYSGLAACNLHGFLNLGIRQP